MVLVGVFEECDAAGEGACGVVGGLDALLEGELHGAEEAVVGGEFSEGVSCGAFDGVDEVGV